MSYQVCSRCVMDNIGDSTVSFSLDGTCNYCNDTLRRKEFEYFPNEKGKELLETSVLKIKKAGVTSSFDCIVGVSGGLDSAYVLYLGHLHGLRMLAIHIDDGFDTATSTHNITALCAKTNTELIKIQPDKAQYLSLLLAFIKASVPNLAVPQDNILMASLFSAAKRYKVPYFLGGSNFSLECILQRGNSINYADKKHILAINRIFGNSSISNLPLISFWDKYILSRHFSSYKTIYPLNYVDYTMEEAIKTLSSFCGFQYYGGKHYENIFTRFLQCYYLPVKYQVDKRKSHFSSMIISGQLTREDALKKLASPLYPEEMKREDFASLAAAFEMSPQEFERLIHLPPKQHTDYPTSFLNKTAPIARKFRKYL